MKKKILIIFVFVFEIGFTQTKFPFFEQIALDIYSSEIIYDFPVKKKIKVYKYLHDLHPEIYWFNTPSCLQNIAWSNNKQFEPIKGYQKKQFDVDSEQFELNTSNLNKKQFKIKKKAKAGYPKLFITNPHKEKGNNNRVFVNIYEVHNELKEIIYHLEFDNKGNIIDWCRTVTEKIITR